MGAKRAMNENIDHSSNELVEQRELQIRCEDEALLAASLYTPSVPRGGVMIAPATGIKRGYYHYFASYLAEQGYIVLSYDNRGIGGSLHGKLVDCRASLRDWGSLDMPAVLELLRAQCPGMPLHLVGHSAGGQLVGLMKNSGLLCSFFNFGSSAGQLRNMEGFFRLKAKFFLNVYSPLSNQIWGYTKSQWVGMGEDLPRVVAKEWAQWCRGRGYVETAFGTTVQEHWYDQLDCPSMWLHATDDDIAVQANVEDMIRVYSRSPSQRVVVEPSEHGLHGEIGHMGFFRRRAKVLWPMASKWFDSHTSPPQASP